MTEILLPEVIEDNSLIEVVACPHPFKAARIDKTITAGLTIRQIIDIIQPNPQLSRFAVVFLEDNLIEPHHWDSIRPAPGARLTIRIIPMGGGGGGKKSILSVVLTIAVITASAYLGPQFAQFATGLKAGSAAAAASTSFGIASAVGSGIVGVAGNLVVSAIAPPSAPRLGQISGVSQSSLESPTAFINGAKNELRPFGVVPRVLGKHRMFPPLGAKTYTEIEGNDQYIRMLVVWGYGPLDIPESSLKIGETLLSQFTDVEIETRQGYPSDLPLTLFTNQVSENALSVKLNQVDGGSTQRTNVGVDEISVDITFDRGLVHFSSSGARGDHTVQVDVEYSVADADTWVSAGSFNITAWQSTSLRRGLRWQVANGQYDVRLKRVTADSDSTQIFDTVFWTVLRSIVCEDPINMANVAKSALRIKATDELQGIIDALNGEPQSIVKDWDTGTQTWIERATSNNASLYREVLQGTANAKAVLDSRVYMSMLEHWHDVCVTNNRQFNMIIDFKTNVDRMLRDIAAAGRARPGRLDGLMSVLIDEAQTTPVQHFSPKNSWDFEGTKAFGKIPHAWKIQFINKDVGYQNDQRLVYRPGYTSANATTFEGLGLIGITDPDQIEKDGLYHFATAIHRPEEYSFYINVANLVCSRGSLIRVTHDVALWGLGSAWVKTVQTSGGNVTGVTLDDFMPMEVGKTYELRFRLKDNTEVLRSVVTNAGEQNILVFNTPIAIASGPQMGDFALFGETGLSSADLIIKDILPGPNLSAQLICVDAAPAVHTADQGTIPPFNSNISLPAGLSKPAIVDIQSGEGVFERTVSGGIIIQMVVYVGFPQNRDKGVTGIELRYRPNGTSSDWVKKTFSPDTITLNVLDVVEGETYEIQSRFLRGAAFGPWSFPLTHKVIGASKPPPDLSGLYLENGVLRWVYPTPPIDFDGFQVRYREGVERVWDDATIAHEGIITETKFDISGIPAGKKVFMVRAYDKSGNPSTNFSSLVKDLGDPIVANLIETIDHDGDGYPGTKTNGTVNATTLEADSDGTPIWTGDSNPIWTGNSNPLWTQQYKKMTYEFDFTPDLDNFDAKVTLESYIEASQFTIEYKTDSSEQMFTDDGNPMFTDDGDPIWCPLPSFKPWPGIMTNLQLSKYFLRARTNSGFIRGKIKKLKVHFDVEDETESFNDIVIASGGSRLPIAKTYRSIKNVSLTLQDDGNGADLIRIIDKNSTLGPLVKATASGGNVSATIDAEIQGVKG